MEKIGRTEAGIEYAMATDVGMRRTNNQDSYVISFSKSDKDLARRGHLFMVADGMGAHAAGELASKMAVDGVSHRYRKFAELAPHLALERALQETNAEVHRRGNANLDFRNMGTTASAMAILPQGVIVAHVGDSRVYRIRDAVIEQLTFDHSVAWELRANGRFPAGEDAASIPKNWITRSLGPSSDVQVDLEGPFPINLGDTYLLCSDGLSGQLQDEEIGVIVSQLSPQDACQVLVDLANLRGGPDNVTVVLARIVDPAVAKAAQNAPALTDAPVQKRVIHPAIWIVGAALAAVGALLAFLVPAVGVIVATLGVLLLLGGGFRLLSNTPHSNSGVLGKGPYRRFNCPVSEASVQMLQKIINDLCEAAESEQWKVRWQPLRDLLAEADAHREQKRFDAAFQKLSRAVTYMMGELRMQEGDAGDSSVDY